MFGFHTMMLLPLNFLRDPNHSLGTITCTSKTGSEILHFITFFTLHLLDRFVTNKSVGVHLILILV